MEAQKTEAFYLFCRNCNGYKKPNNIFGENKFSAMPHPQSVGLRIH